MTTLYNNSYNTIIRDFHIKVLLREAILPFLSLKAFVGKIDTQNVKNFHLNTIKPLENAQGTQETVREHCITMILSSNASHHAAFSLKPCVYRTRLLLLEVCVERGFFPEAAFQNAAFSPKPRFGMIGKKFFKNTIKPLENAPET